MRPFQIFFVLKTTYFHFVHTPHRHPIEIAIILSALVACASSPLSRVGMIGVLATCLWHVWVTFPYTINHHFLEALIAFVLLMWPPRLAALIIKVAIGSLWFFSGVQKLVHGYWTNGEFLAVRYLFGKGRFRNILPKYLPAPFYKPYREFFEIGLDGGSFEATWWMIAFILAISWFVIIAEIGLPFLLLSSKYRKLGAVLLICIQLFVGIESQEQSFMYTGVACLLLFLW